MAGACLTVPLAAEAQKTARVPRVAFLLQNSVESGPHLTAAFRQGLRERGWTDGENIAIEVRSADGKVDRLPALVAELIHLNVDIIVSTSSGSTWAAKN